MLSSQRRYDMVSSNLCHDEEDETAQEVSPFTGRSMTATYLFNNLPKFSAVGLLSNTAGTLAVCETLKNSQP